MLLPIKGGILHDTRKSIPGMMFISQSLVITNVVSDDTCVIQPTNNLSPNVFQSKYNLTPISTIILCEMCRSIYDM